MKVYIWAEHTTRAGALAATDRDPVDDWSRYHSDDYVAHEGSAQELYDLSEHVGASTGAAGTYARSVGRALRLAVLEREEVERGECADCGRAGVLVDTPDGDVRAADSGLVRVATRGDEAYLCGASTGIGDAVCDDCEEARCAREETP